MSPSLNYASSNRINTALLWSTSASAQKWFHCILCFVRQRRYSLPRRLAGLVT